MGFSWLQCIHGCLKIVLSSLSILQGIFPSQNNPTRGRTAPAVPQSPGCLYVVPAGSRDCWNSIDCLCGE